MKFLFLITLIATSFSCKSQINCAYKGGKVEYLSTINCNTDFLALKAPPLKSTFANVNSIKIVYEISNDIIYYTQSVKYPFHFSFVKEYLKTYDDLKEFNNIEYGNSRQRLYAIANLNHYTNSNIYTLEFFPDDEIDAATIEKLFNKIKSTSYFGNQVKILNQSWNTEKLKSTNLPLFPIDSIYKGQQYQSLLNGIVLGKLKFVQSNADLKNIQATDIVIANFSPNNMPLCAATVTSVYQTPLCHINVLAQNRKTPNAVLTTIFGNKKIVALENKLVQLTVNNDSITLKETTEKEFANWLAYRSYKSVVKLSADYSEEKLLPIKKLHVKKVNVVGGKAANMGELNKIKLNRKNKLNLPDHVFAIPFYYYKQHITDNKIEPLIQELLKDSVLWNNKEQLQAKLNIIQEAIKKAPIDATLINLIRQEIGADSTANFRYRSSTNAEDVLGFNGAGLYDSKTGNLTNRDKAVDNAIKAVWASAWNIRAFEERVAFNIDQTNIAMGILVNKAFGVEEANGVAVTKNLYRDDYPAYTINVQQGENSVVHPDSGVLTEQFLIMDIDAVKQNGKVAVDYICKSSLTNGNYVMTEAEVKLLATYLTAIKKHFWKKIGKKWRIANRGKSSKEKGYYNQIAKVLPLGSYNNFGLDIEFKLEAKTREIVIKQVRVY